MNKFELWTLADRFGSQFFGRNEYVQELRRYSNVLKNKMVRKNNPKKVEEDEMEEYANIYREMGNLAQDESKLWEPMMQKLKNKK